MKNHAPFFTNPEVLKDYPVILWDPWLKRVRYSFSPSTIPSHFHDCYMIDLASSIGWGRFGKLSKNSRWVHIPLEYFPPEFKTQLLLLGIDINEYY